MHRARQPAPPRFSARRRLDLGLSPRGHAPNLSRCRPCLLDRGRRTPRLCRTPTPRRSRLTGIPRSPRPRPVHACRTLPRSRALTPTPRRSRLTGIPRSPRPPRDAHAARRHAPARSLQRRAARGSRVSRAAPGRARCTHAARCHAPARSLQRRAARGLRVSRAAPGRARYAHAPRRHPAARLIERCAATRARGAWLSRAAPGQARRRCASRSHVAARSALTEYPRRGLPLSQDGAESVSLLFAWPAKSSSPGRSRTDKSVRTRDFKSPAFTVSPRGQNTRWFSIDVAR